MTDKAQDVVFPKGQGMIHQPVMPLQAALDAYGVLEKQATLFHAATQGFFNPFLLRQ